MLAQCDDGKALVGRTRHAFFNGRGDGLIEGMVGKIRQNARDAGEVPNTR